MLQSSFDGAQLEGCRAKTKGTKRLGVKKLPLSILAQPKPDVNTPVAASYHTILNKLSDFRKVHGKLCFRQIGVARFAVGCQQPQ